MWRKRLIGIVLAVVLVAAFDQLLWAMRRDDLQRGAWLTQLALAHRVYAHEHGGALPPATAQLDVRYDLIRQPDLSTYGRVVYFGPRGEDDPGDAKPSVLLMELPRPYLGPFGLYFLDVALSEPDWGGMVAYTDGTVVFLQYPGAWPMTRAMVDRVAKSRGALIAR